VPSAQLTIGVPVDGLASRMLSSTQVPTRTAKIDPVQTRIVFEGFFHSDIAHPVAGAAVGAPRARLDLVPMLLELRRQQVLLNGNRSGDGLVPGIRVFRTERTSAEHRALQPSAPEVAEAERLQESPGHCEGMGVAGRPIVEAVHQPLDGRPRADADQPRAAEPVRAGSSPPGRRYPALSLPPGASPQHRR